MYKGASLIPATIDSVRAQTLHDWEMIVVDDYSPDDGAGIAVVKQYMEKDGRIKPFRLPENRGSSGARNEAMRRASGRFFAFLDSDDLWDRNYLEVMMNHIKTIKEEKAAIFFSGYRRMNSDCTREVLKPYFAEGTKDFNALLRHCPIFPSAAILDRSKPHSPVFFREELCSLRDDYVFWLDIMNAGFVAVGFSDILVSYRMRDDSLTASKRKMILPQWNIYRNTLGMNFCKSLYYLCLWAINGINKYSKHNNL